MPTYGLLDQSEEDSLHAQRLLNFEEKTFKKLTKRLLSHDSLLNAPASFPSSVPADTTAADEAAAAHETQQRTIEEQRRQWRDDMLLDFAAYESNIIRVQLLLNANERERERYAAERVRIQETAQAVRDNNTQLREQLVEAQKTMEIRKGYDALADKITSNKTLRPRDEQHAAIEKLHAEIAELELERSEYSKTWAERREQFGRIVEEGMQMLRLIRDEKEEAERQEGMEEMDDDTDPSKTGTPRVGTPRVADGAATPLQSGADGGTGSGFQRSAEQSLGVTPILNRASRTSSNATEHKDTRIGDISMTERNSDEHEEGEDHTELEEGEATDHNDQSEDKMDTT